MENRTPLRAPLQLAAAGVLVLALLVVFHGTLQYLYFNWHREEYSHGFLIPLISLYLLWSRRAALSRDLRGGAWSGLLVILLGLTVAFVGLGASIVGIDAYALIVVIAGCIVVVAGWRGLRTAAVPIALLLLMVPLPTFWYNNLSSELQLLSSQLGVLLIRLSGVSVYLEGNVIDLGSYKLEVAQACSGLRYLFPLMTLGAIIAYLFKGKLWTRWFLVLSTLPIAVLVNSVRIGAIGVLVDRFGPAQAEGLLHELEGWFMFMVCLGLLILEAKLLLRLSGDRRSFWQTISVQSDPPRQDSAREPLRRGIIPMGWPVVGAALVLMFAVYPALALPQRSELRPSHKDFSAFPGSVAGWVARRERIEQVYLDELKLDDYLLADFSSDEASRAAARPGVNLYVAYYASQRTGQSVHSPRSCLPGGGWHIEQLEQRTLGGLVMHGNPLRVNRAVIRQGANRQLVYYWFDERGRVLTSEYLVKWYLLSDSLVMNRTDGALVRLITPLTEGEDASAGDARLQRFSADLLPVLVPYIAS
jgi:exosortase D (VPLPA-CTERM-specific)